VRRSHVLGEALHKIATGKHQKTERKLREAEITYSELAKRLKKHGFKDETESSVTNKLSRGTFPATWFLACLAALELDGVALEEI
jgi:Domain of unknown function (DUF6471)